MDQWSSARKLFITILWTVRQSRVQIFCEMWFSYSVQDKNSSWPFDLQVVEPKVRAYLYTWGDGRHTGAPLHPSAICSHLVAC